MSVMIVNMKQKTMTSILKKISAVLFLGAIITVVPSKAFAQESVSYTVSPTIFDMTANPGQTFKSTLRIINTNSFELHVYIDLNNFVPKGEDGVPQFVPIDSKIADQTSLAQWISTDKELVIGAEQTVELPIVINVPDDASPGGHFAAVMVGTRPLDGAKDKTQVQTSQTISSLVFLRVTGNITESSTIRSFRTSSYFLSKPEATFEIRIENKGNVHLQPQGEIKIFNMWGEERGTIPINQQSLFGNVLPNSVRKFSFTWSSEWSFSDIGRYTAVATLAYGIDTRQFMTADTAFWIIPWKILLTILAVVGGFVALLSWAIKVYVRRMLTLAGVTPDSRVQMVSEPTKKGRPTKKSQESVKEKTRRFAAPIEAGILDLRSKLHGKNNFKARLAGMIVFVKLYWKFFAVFSAIVIFGVLLAWFFKGAFGPAHDYKIHFEGENRDVTVSSSSTGETPPATISTTHSSTTEVAVVNRSGEEFLSEKVTQLLTQNGYTVSSSTSDIDSTEAKTVVVYDPKDVEIALAISKLLDNALLSAYTDAGEHKEIVVYVGKDTKTTP